MNGFIEIKLREPYWGAWKKYGWEQGVEGFGVDGGKIIQAAEQNKMIRVVTEKYGTYEISPEDATNAVKKYNSVYKARRNKKIGVIPRNLFTKI